jgi:CheY-like chemotaxis protein/HPt (histidine-containing phosphotransfer) domain-containing protein
LLQAIYTMFQQKASEKHISFVMHQDKLLPVSVFGDPTRLNQILVNLINNAIKFTPHGSVELNCELKNIEHNLATLVFRVKDTGIGIPKDKIDLIFERFNQGNKETTRKFGGTGLGLAIVKNLVELQNGEVYLKSKEGFGSEFVVYLSYPLVFENNTVPAENIKLSFDNLANGDKKILLVEDNTLNQKLALAFLTEFGFAADCVNNGEEAIKKLNENTYDLVLMDIQMPVMDGYSCTRAIRQRLCLTLPVIAMTAHVTSGEKDRCLEAGMNDYISKPFHEKDLYEMLAKHLSLKTGLKELRSQTPKKHLHAEALVNTQNLIDLSRGNTQFIFDMVDIYTEQNPTDIGELAAAIKNMQYTDIRLVAHRMKTSVGFMGITSLLQQLSDLESLAEKKAEASVIEQCFVRIKADSRQSVADLQQFKDTLIKNHKP